MASMVYRYDRAATRNWTREIGGTRLSLLPRQAGRVRDAVLRLQVEYIEKCVPVGSALSLPVEDAPDTLRYFVVVVKHPTRKKLMQSETLRQQRAMCFPASVQWLTKRPLDSQLGQLGQPDDIAVLYHGVPEVVDFLELAPWSVLRHGLVRYSMAASALGHLALTAPEPIRPCLEA